MIKKKKKVWATNHHTKVFMGFNCEILTRDKGVPDPSLNNSQTFIHISKNTVFECNS